MELAGQNWLAISDPRSKPLGWSCYDYKIHQLISMEITNHTLSFPSLSNFVPSSSYNSSLVGKCQGFLRDSLSLYGGSYGGVGKDNGGVQLQVGIQIQICCRFVMGLWYVSFLAGCGLERGSIVYLPFYLPLLVGSRMHVLPNMGEVEPLPLFFIAIFLLRLHVSYMHMEKEFLSLREKYQ